MLTGAEQEVAIDVSKALRKAAGNDETSVELIVWCDLGGAPGTVVLSQVGGCWATLETLSEPMRATHALEKSIREDTQRETIPDENVRVQIAPNPANPSVSFTLDLRRADTVSVSVYDLKGRLVRRVAQSGSGAGKLTISWDGTDAEGAEVASGVYLCRISGGTFAEKIGKVSIVR